jgi:hypothetical protein
MSLAPPTSRKVVLVGCVKTKQDGKHAAKDPYVSPLVRKRRSYAEASGLPWFILSAEHGLVHPDTPLQPYDRTLNTMRLAQRADWGRRVVRELLSSLGDIRYVTFEVHAGAR